MNNYELIQPVYTVEQMMEVHKGYSAYLEFRRYISYLTAVPLTREEEETMQIELAPHDTDYLAMEHWLSKSIGGQEDGY